MKNKVKEIDKIIADLHSQKERMLRSRTVKCPKCEKRTALKNATVIRSFSYVPPHGCTEGAYWAADGEYQYYCGKCDHFNRAYVLSWDKERVAERKYDIDRIALYEFIKTHYSYFGEQLDYYGEGGTIDNIRTKDKERKQKERDRGW